MGLGFDKRWKDKEQLRRKVRNTSGSLVSVIALLFCHFIQGLLTYMNYSIKYCFSSILTKPAWYSIPWLMWLSAYIVVRIVTELWDYFPVFCQAVTTIINKPYDLPITVLIYDSITLGLYRIVLNKNYRVLQQDYIG